MIALPEIPAPLAGAVLMLIATPVVAWWLTWCDRRTR